MTKMIAYIVDIEETNTKRYVVRVPEHVTEDAFWDKQYEVEELIEGVGRLDHDMGGNITMTEVRRHPEADDEDGMEMDLWDEGGGDGDATDDDDDADADDDEEED